MASYRDKVTASMDLLTQGLAPFVEMKLQGIHQDHWQSAVAASFRDERQMRQGEDGIDWDAQMLLTVMWDQWNAVFRTDLGHFERSLVSELRDVRNRWAHQQSFDFDDTFRVLDSVQRLLAAVQASNVAVVQREKDELLESHVAEAVNSQVARKTFERNRRWVIAVYIFCGLLIVAQCLMHWTAGSPVLISGVLVFFAYLVYQRVTMDPPLLYGPHACERCQRIIYRKTCPYCEAR